MHIQKEEAEALRRIPAILAPRLSPEERKNMARKIEARISGTHTSIIAFRYWQIAALCHPGNPEKAQEMESQIVAAVDSGELLPSIDDRSLKGLFLSDLSAWPECPPIAEDSPLRVWLPFVPTVPAQAEASPVEAGPEPVWIAQAQEQARSIVKRQGDMDLYPSQMDIADEIARDFRKRGIVGASGKPLSADSIKRHALKGISSAKGRQLSTSVHRGKWGKK